MKKIISISTLVLLFGGALMFVTSCSKHDDGNYGPNTETNQEKNLRKIKELVRKLPIMKVVNEAQHRNNGGGKEATILDAGFSFADPNSGAMHFSSPNGVTYVANPNGGVGFTVSSAAFGSNSISGGTVVAGSSNLEINFTFCFNSSGNAVGLDLFDMGTTFTGVSAVIGVSGDFQALADGGPDSSHSFSDVFHGLAFYIVFDGQAAGSYDVFDWLNDDINDSLATDRKCFTFVIDFVDGHLYMSTSGTVNVTGGTMDFNGEYIDLGGVDLDDIDVDDPDLTISIVPGFGAMGCN